MIKSVEQTINSHFEKFMNSEQLSSNKWSNFTINWYCMKINSKTAKILNVDLNWNCRTYSKQMSTEE